MPIYVYICPKCGRRDVVLRPIHDMNIPTFCADCFEEMERKPTAADFIRSPKWERNMPPDKPGRRG